MVEGSARPRKSSKSNKSISPRLALIGILVVAALICVALITANLSKLDVTTEREQGSALVASEIIKSFNISTLTYRYTNLIYEKDVKKIGNIELPFTEAYLGVRYDGVIEIGFDGNEIEVIQTDDVITIKLPAAKVLSHTQVDGTTEVLFDMGTVFNQNEIGGYIELFEAEKQAMETRAEEMGLFEEARANAQEQLLNFLYAFPDIKDNYTIVFK
ncbi:MAG: DUF4230 domain-containing protein [Eggerthellaceae bacterium]|jgi:hypothetical protein|nr:DUF4230 domain-containing protein [Eggerthellaceae bacterium]